MATIDLAARVVGRTRVTPRLSRYFFLGGTAAGSTTVSLDTVAKTHVVEIESEQAGGTTVEGDIGYLAQLEGLTVDGSTAVSGDIGYVAPLAATVAGSTTVAASFEGLLRAEGTRIGRTSVSASLRRISPLRTAGGGAGVALSSGTPTMVSLSTGIAGSSTFAAHGDHSHELDQSIAPTWTGIHRFNANISHIRNVAYTWPSSQGAAGTQLQNDGSGGLSWVSPGGFNTALDYTLTGKWTFQTAAANGTYQDHGVWAQSHIQISGGGWTGNIYQISMGYKGGTTNAPVAIGSKTTTDTSNTQADFFVATRNVTTDTQPTIRFRVHDNGDFTFGNQRYTFPTTAGSNAYVLQTNGSGVLSWVAAGGVPDPLTLNQFIGNNGAVDATPRGYWLNLNGGTSAPALRMSSGDVIIIGGGASPNYNAQVLIRAAGADIGQFSASGLTMSTTPSVGTITAPVLVGSQSGTTDLTLLKLDHAGGFTATDMETRLDFVQGATVLGRVANYYAGSTTWGLKFYGYTGGATTLLATLAPDGRFTVAQLTINTVAYTWPSADGSNGYILKTNGSGTLAWVAVSTLGVTSINSLAGAVTIAGTSNQVNVNTAGSTITLSTPQDIHTGASPTFAGATLDTTRPTLTLTMTGQTRKVRLNHYVAGSAYLTANTYFDGTNWNLDDTGNAGAVYAFSGAGPLALYAVPASANPATLGLVFAVSPAGQVSVPTTGSSAGILIGGDAQIYRSAADTLRTPDSLTVDATFLATGSLHVGAIDAARTVNVEKSLPANNLDFFVKNSSTATSTNGVRFIIAADGENNTGDVLFRFIAQSGGASEKNAVIGLDQSANTVSMQAGSALDGTKGVHVNLNTGQVAIPTTGSSAGLLIGGDVQLYRSAADVLTVPDNIVLSRSATHAEMKVQTNDASYQAQFRVSRSGAASNNCDWYFYIPGASTDLRIFQSSDLFTFTTAGNFVASGSITSKVATAGIGYSTGAGGAVTQATNKSTGVTINTVCGAITMNNAALAAAAEVTFVVTNSAVAATDTILVNVKSGAVSAASYFVGVGAVGAGSFSIVVSNLSGGSLSEALVLNFAVIKAVAS